MYAVVHTLEYPAGACEANVQISPVVVNPSCDRHSLLTELSAVIGPAWLRRRLTVVIASEDGGWRMEEDGRREMRDAGALAAPGLHTQTRLHPNVGRIVGVNSRILQRQVGRVP